MTMVLADPVSSTVAVKVWVLVVFIRLKWWVQ
jgi:hypothetical protein